MLLPALQPIHIFAANYLNYTIHEKNASFTYKFSECLRNNHNYFQNNTSVNFYRKIKS